MKCKEMTRQQLIERFSSDWGFSSEVTEKFDTEVLRKACESSSPYLHLKNLIYFMMKGLIEVELKKEE